MIKMANREFLAKPTGITLETHLKDVLEETNNIICAHPFVFEKYYRLTGKDLKKRLLLASKYHDDGKKHEFWQSACWKDYQEYLQTNELKGTNLKRTGIRHEMQSLFMHNNSSFSNPVKIAIASHHAKLGIKFKDRWENDGNKKYRPIWESFKRLDYSVSFNIDRIYGFKLSILKNYEFAGVRSLLQLADHRASILEENKTVPEFKKFNYYFNPEWEKREVQKIAEENWKDELLLLRAPTGSGKTDAALLWAKKQIDNGKADRLVIAMPTRFTSNALAINVTKTLSDTGLYHSSSWFTKYYRKSGESKVTNHFARLEHEFARILETSVTICTIDHLLVSLTHSREDHHAISFNLAHSCLVIDEADFYDEFTQANIIELLKVLKILNVPVLIMSASLPQSSLQLYQTTGYNVKDIKEDTSDNIRIRCKVNSITNYTKVNELSDILANSKKQPAIIFANTIAKAFEFYNYFSKEERKQIILYHSRFTEPDKIEKENKLLNKLGKEAWQNGQASGIAILTQIGEMSVNISANYMISDICPIDRLIQRIGRLARFFHLKNIDSVIGLIEILIPYKKGNVYPAPYGDYINRKGWEINKPFSETINGLECKSYSAEELIYLVNQIYPDMLNFTITTQSNRDNLVDQIISNWLILPDSHINDDEDETHIWKSRNIEKQREIFVIEPKIFIEELYSSQKSTNSKNDCYFRNYKDFMYYKNQSAILCPEYVFRNALNTKKINQSREIWIGDDKVPKYVWLTDYYNSETGLILDDCDEIAII